LIRAIAKQSAHVTKSLFLYHNSPFFSIINFCLFLLYTWYFKTIKKSRKINDGKVVESMDWSDWFWNWV